ncbi:MAG: carboxypeptidase-like regulatory domain-containing protein, partial [Arenibacter sp.]|nr:carboxypeptidase-like regulatory domain-containing protein [Arenibacter sp.]
MKIKDILLLISFLLFVGYTNAQDNITVRGMVTDTDNQPLPGASVIVKGTTTGTQTDFDGNFVLGNVPGNGTLVFSYLGFTTVEIPVNNQTSFTIQLEEDAQALDEVVVVGYGEMRVKDLTSAITTIKSEELAATPTGQAMQALQGKVAGLQIVGNGSPGQSPTVRVRGIGS